MISQMPNSPSIFWAMRFANIASSIPAVQGMDLKNFSFLVC
jgi:hypothetical protein